MLVGGSGAREKNEKLAECYRMDKGLKVTYCTFFNCVVESVINAVRCLRGDGDAKKATQLFKKCSIQFTTLGQFSPVTHSYSQDGN